MRGGAESETLMSFVIPCTLRILIFYKQRLKKYLDVFTEGKVMSSGVEHNSCSLNNNIVILAPANTNLACMSGAVLLNHAVMPVGRHIVDYILYFCFVKL